MPAETRNSSDQRYYFGESRSDKAKYERGIAQILEFSRAEDYIRLSEPTGDGDHCHQPQPPLGTTHVFVLKQLPNGGRTYLFLKEDELETRIGTAIGGASWRGLSWDLRAREVDAVYVQEKRRRLIGFYLFPEEQH